MPIALTPVQLSQSPQTAPIISGGGDGGARTAGARTHGRAPANAAGESPVVAQEWPQGEKITLAAANDASSARYIPAAPYAEIWKDGRKIAEIDSRGEVNSFDGSVAAPLGGGSGLSLAAQRAAMIARSVGGEIRVAGVVSDASTLAMSARLRVAYGA